MENLTWLTFWAISRRNRDTSLGKVEQTCINIKYYWKSDAVIKNTYNPGQTNTNTSSEHKKWIKQDVS